MAMSDHIAGLQSGHAKGDSETRQNGRSVRRRGTCSGYAYVSPGCGTGKMGVFSGNGMEFLFLRKKNSGKCPPAKKSAPTAPCSPCWIKSTK